MRDDTAIEAGPDALAITGLCVAYRGGGRQRAVLRDLTFRVGQGEAYGLVGESGCGKSTAALAAMRYLPRAGAITAGRIAVGGVDLMSLDGEALRRMRARRMSMVHQDPGKALNPSIRIGRQVAEVFEVAGIGGKEAMERAADMLARVRLSDPSRVMERYPHQLSGGMQQRVAIAMALASDPAMLILDEPTTGLDATVEADVLDLIAQLRQEFGTSILFISHNLAVISRMCDRVGVLYAGMLVEEGPTRALFEAPRHPYTVALLRCLPRGGQSKHQGRLDIIPGFLPEPGAAIPGCAFADRCALADDRCRTEPPSLIDLGGRLSRCHHHERAPLLARSTPAVGARATPARATPAEAGPSRPRAPVLEVTALGKTFGARGHLLRAVSDVSLSLAPGETLGLVGESGSGKTTLARMLLGLVPPDAGGRIALDGKTVAPTLDARSMDDVKALQIVFQNPDSALNRAHTAGRIIGRALRRLGGLRGAALRERLRALVSDVRLTDRHMRARPSQLSGGLKQRVAIARAFAGDPRVVVCDEPTSALDVSVQAAILNLLADLQASHQVSYVFISHDLAVVRYLADRIVVLYLGRVMETGPAERVLSGARHPYTEALLSAVPMLGGEERPRIRLQGEIPSAVNPPTGCVFHTRCPRKIGPICEEREPALEPDEAGHAIRCHIPVAELSRSQGAAPVAAMAEV